MSNKQSSPSSSTTQGKNLLVVAGVGALAIGGFLAYKLLTKVEDKQPTQAADTKQRQLTTSSSSVQASSTNPLCKVYNESLLTVDASKWKEFIHEELGIRFKYPPNYRVTAGVNEFESFAFNIEPISGNNQARIIILIEDQADFIPAESYLQQGIVAVSLVGSQVVIQEENAVVAGGLDGAEMDFITTTSNPNQRIRTWALAVTSPSRAISIQYVTSDQPNFDDSLAKNIAKTLQITEKAHDVSVRVHTKNYNLSMTLPNYRYQTQKPSSSNEVIICCGTMSGSLVTEMIEVRAVKNVDFGQFVEKYKREMQLENVDFKILEEASLSSNSNNLSIKNLFTYSSNDSNVTYRFIDALFSHNGVTFIVHTKCLATNFDSFKVAVTKSLSSIAFNERMNLNGDTFTYRNNAHGFEYDVSASVVVKQHSLQPIVTFLSKPNNTETDDALLSETQIACKETAPIQSTALLRDIVMLELNEAQSTTIKLRSEKQVTVDNKTPALQLTYSMKEPLTGQNVVFVQTTFLADSTHVMSLKSWTVESLFTESVERQFTTEHSTFKFTNNKNNK